MTGFQVCTDGLAPLIPSSHLLKCFPFRVVHFGQLVACAATDTKPNHAISNKMFLLFYVISGRALQKKLGMSLLFSSGSKRNGFTRLFSC